MICTTSLGRIVFNYEYGKVRKAWGKHTRKNVRNAGKTRTGNKARGKHTIKNVRNAGKTRTGNKENMSGVCHGQTFDILYTTSLKNDTVGLSL